MTRTCRWGTYRCAAALSKLSNLTRRRQRARDGGRPAEGASSRTVSQLHAPGSATCLGPEICAVLPLLPSQISEGGIDNYFAAIRRSKFCLAPYGHGWGIRTNIYMAHGCIPVIIQDHVFQVRSWRCVRVQWAAAPQDTGQCVKGRLHWLQA
jgi:hypothetical protein